MAVRSRGVLIGLLLGLATLTGCTVEGRVEVKSPTLVDVDVTVRASRSPYCNADIVGLSTIPERGRAGIITSCRYVGSVDPSQLGWALGLASAGEYLVGVFNPLQVSSTGPGESVENQLDAVDVTIAMPGSVQEANSGRVSDREVRITDPEVLILPGGLRVVSLNHLGPAHWVWWVTGGALVGAVAAAVLLMIVQRIRRGRTVRTPGRGESESPPAAVDTVAAGADNGPERQEPDSADVFATAPPPDPDHRPEGDYDPALWAAVPAYHDAAERDAPARRDRADPSIWAPEE